MNTKLSDLIFLKRTFEGNFLLNEDDTVGDIIGSVEITDSIKVIEFYNHCESGININVDKI